jgi:hypothetical protein
MVLASVLLAGGVLAFSGMSVQEPVLQSPVVTETAAISETLAEPPHVTQPAPTAAPGEAGTHTPAPHVPEWCHEQRILYGAPRGMFGPLRRSLAILDACKSYADTILEVFAESALMPEAVRKSFSDASARYANLRADLERGAVRFELLEPNLAAMVEEFVPAARRGAAQCGQTVIVESHEGVHGSARQAAAVLEFCRLLSSWAAERETVSPPIAAQYRANAELFALEAQKFQRGESAPRATSAEVERQYQALEHELNLCGDGVVMSQQASHGKLGDVAQTVAALEHCANAYRARIEQQRRAGTLTSRNSAAVSALRSFEETAQGYREGRYVPGAALERPSRDEQIVARIHELGRRVIWWVVVFAAFAAFLSWLFGARSDPSLPLPSSYRPRPIDPPRPPEPPSPPVGDRSRHGQ